MKCNRSALALFVGAALIPMSAAVLLLFDYELVMHRMVVPVILFALLYSALSVRLLGVGEHLTDMGTALPIACTLPLWAVNLYIALWESSLLMLAAAGLCTVLSGVLLFKMVKVKWLKILSAVVSAVLILPFGFAAFMLLVFGQIGRNTVVSTEYSPEGTYRAEVIDSNQGALGGDTLVMVYDETSRMDFYFFALQKSPQRVYLGEWGEFADMEINWESEHVLNIDGVSHEIK